MRLLEADARAISIMAPAAGPSGSTQASNFSFCRRPPHSRGVWMVSTPNWRKHSANKLLDDSYKSKSATRAIDLRWLGRVGAVANDVLMSPGLNSLEVHSDGGFGGWTDFERA